MPKRVLWGRTTYVNPQPLPHPLAGRPGHARTARAQRRRAEKVVRQMCHRSCHGGQPLRLDRRSGVEDSMFAWFWSLSPSCFLTDDIWFPSSVLYFSSVCLGSSRWHLVRLEVMFVTSDRSLDHSAVRNEPHVYFGRAVIVFDKERSFYVAINFLASPYPIRVRSEKQKQNNFSFSFCTAGSRTLVFLFFFLPAGVSMCFGDLSVMRHLSPEKKRELEVGFWLPGDLSIGGHLAMGEKVFVCGDHSCWPCFFFPNKFFG